jgi:hypothetical protein
VEAPAVGDVFCICCGTLGSLILSGEVPALGDVFCFLVSVTALGNTKVLGNNKRIFPVVWKELCYRKAKTLGDAEEAARWRQDNFVR